MVSGVAVGSFVVSVGATGFVSNAEDAVGKFLETHPGGWTGCAGYRGARDAGFVRDAGEAGGMTDIWKTEASGDIMGFVS